MHKITHAVSVRTRSVHVMITHEHTYTHRHAQTYTHDTSEMEFMRMGVSADDDILASFEKVELRNERLPVWE